MSFDADICNRQYNEMVVSKKIFISNMTFYYHVQFVVIVPEDERMLSP